MFQSEYSSMANDPESVEPFSGSASVVVDAAKFNDLMSLRAARLLAFCQYLRRQDSPVGMNRLLVSFISGEVSLLEELLDAYGARNNKDWHFFRTLIGGTKAFSAVAFELLHLLHTYKRYPNLPDKTVFAQSTTEALEAVTQILSCQLDLLLDQAINLGISLPHTSQFHAPFYGEDLPEGTLPRNRQSSHIVTATQRIVHLATVFLNLAARGNFLDKAARAEKIEGLIPEALNEEVLMQLEYNFHSLQSLYDTYVFDSTTEVSDPDLKTMRGHISIIYHLLEVSTQTVHFYERHMVAYNTGLLSSGVCPGTQHQHIVRLIKYAVGTTGKYLVSGRGLCRTMLRRYAEIASVEVPIPSYRGFHVRPSTLVAKIVQHYGSEVTMTMDEDSYDAGSPLDLFRANEHITALKRRRVGEALAKIPGFDEKPVPESDFSALLRKTVFELAGQSIIFIYQRPLQLDEVSADTSRTLHEIMFKEIIKLLGAGKIDIEMKKLATFTGDKRVLNDLTVLATNGYCEDSFGNNIPIPSELGYLKRS